MFANTDHALDSTLAPATNAAGLAPPSSASGSATVGSGGGLLGGTAGTGSTQTGSVASKVGVYATAHAQARVKKYEFVCERKSDGRKPHAETGYEREDVVAVYYHKEDPQKQEFEVVPKAAHLNDPQKAMNDVNQRWRKVKDWIAKEAERAAATQVAQAQAQHASAATAVQQTSAHQQQMDTDIQALAGQAAALQAGIAQLQAPLQHAVTSNQDAASRLSAQQATLGQLQVNVQTAAAAHQAADDAAAAPTSAVPAATLASAFKPLPTAAPKPKGVSTCMSSGLPDLGGPKKGAAVSGGMSQPSTTGNAELGRFVTDARQKRQGTGKGKGIVSSSTSKGSNIHTLADYSSSESEDDAPPKKKATRAAPKKRDATQSEIDLTKVSWDVVSNMSSRQGYDDAVMADVLARTLNDDDPKADPDSDFVLDSIDTATAKPDRRTRSTRPAAPTSKDHWSCFKCMKTNPPRQETCGGTTCDGKRADGTIVPTPQPSSAVGRASGPKVASKSVSKPIPAADLTAVQLPDQQTFYATERQALVAQEYPDGDHMEQELARRWSVMQRLMATEAASGGTTQPAATPVSAACQKALGPALRAKQLQTVDTNRDKVLAQSLWKGCYVNGVEVSALPAYGSLQSGDVEKLASTLKTAAGVSVYIDWVESTMPAKAAGKQRMRKQARKSLPVLNTRLAPGLHAHAEAAVNGQQQHGKRDAMTRGAAKVKADAATGKAAAEKVTEHCPRCCDPFPKRLKRLRKGVTPNNPNCNICSKTLVDGEIADPGCACSSFICVRCFRNPPIIMPMPPGSDDSE